MNQHALQRLSLESNIRLALREGQFKCFYQPKVDAKMQSITGAEILIRWCHPDMGILSPGQFLTVAEEIGLIGPITEALLTELMLSIKRWAPLQVQQFKFAVNVSSSHFKQENFLPDLLSILDKHEVSHDMLELEITEEILMKSDKKMVAMLHNLIANDITLAIDDFGTGYSSLNYLKSFPITRLKIDRTFIRDVTTNPDDAIITRTIIAMARSMNLQVTAEGVEEKDQLDFLKAEDCDEIQGFYYSLPLSSEDFEKVLTQYAEGVDIETIFNLYKSHNSES